jgi:hypothetical protein
MEIWLLTVGNSEHNIFNCTTINIYILHSDIARTFLFTKQSHPKKRATKIASINRDIGISFCSSPSTMSSYAPKWQVRRALFPFLECAQSAYFQKRKHIICQSLFIPVWWLSTYGYLVVFGRYPVHMLPKMETHMSFLKMVSQAHNISISGPSRAH